MRPHFYVKIDENQESRKNDPIWGLDFANLVEFGPHIGFWRLPGPSKTVLAPPGLDFMKSDAIWSQIIDIFLKTKP